MQQVFRAYGRYQGIKGNVSSLPSWGKPILLVAALPGILVLIAAVALFVLLLVVSILALLLLTAPVYRFLTVFKPRPQQVEVTSPPPGEEVFVQQQPRRPIEVKILE